MRRFAPLALAWALTGCGLVLDLQPPGPDGMDGGTNDASTNDAGPPEACASDDDCPDDDNPCNGTVVCDTAIGLCVSSSGPACEATQPCMVARCDPASGCVEVPRDCPDDGVACTIELCDPSQDRCVRRPDSSQCRAPGLCEVGYCRLDGGCDYEDLCAQLDPAAYCDGDACVLPDACDDGIGGNCRPLSPCLRATCESDHCVQRPAGDGAACMSDACTSGTCDGGLCRPGDPTTCAASSNPCVTVSCDPVLGCVEQPLDMVPCDLDGSPCTDDMCRDGSCVAGAPCPDTLGDCVEPTCNPDGTCGVRVLLNTSCNSPTGCGVCDAAGSGVCLIDSGCTCPGGTRPCMDSMGLVDCCGASEVCTPGGCFRTFSCSPNPCGPTERCCPCNGTMACWPFGTPCAGCPG